MWGTIYGAIEGAVTSSYCFVAGTTVLTATGVACIEHIRAGDKVYTWNEETGQVEIKTVVETYINESNELVHVFVDGEKIVSTPSHPFYSPAKGWTKAIDLRAGDVLQTINGEVVIVEWVQHEILESPVKVYNFQVEDDHTYYVASGVLVHNKCGGETSATKRGREMHNSWNYGEGVKKEVKIGLGARVDGYDEVNKIIYELKPNNPKAIKRGNKQLERYLEVLNKEGWTGILVLYD